jgi:VanZ family protein
MNRIKVLLVRKEFLLVLALLWTGVILFFCLIKSSSIPVIKIQNLDKAVHAFFHFVFTAIWFLYFQKQFVKVKFQKLTGVCFCFSVIFGILIEIAQSLFTTTRNGDVLDVLSNTTGAAIAVGVLVYYFKNKNLDLKI